MKFSSKDEGLQNRSYTIFNKEKELCNAKYFLFNWSGYAFLSGRFVKTPFVLTNQLLEINHQSCSLSMHLQLQEQHHQKQPQQELRFASDDDVGASKPVRP